ncbi:MAG TPA: hypothetical protein VEL02_14085 [Jatrophihabitantaceae bacterium]|nr:hypothetical protein [Jatrophihabitantaceae bacterium]
MLLTLGVTAGLLAVPVASLSATVISGSGSRAAAAAPAVESVYQWEHVWSSNGTGVTTQHSTDNFIRTSYFHGGTCSEQKFQFWASGTVATYYRKSPSYSSSCSGVAWTLRWKTPNAGTNSTLNWQADRNLVLRNSAGAAVWASGTSHGCCASERQRLNYGWTWYLDYDDFGFWVTERTYP